MIDFDIARIRQAADRLDGRIVRTPVLSSPVLDDIAGANLFVKAESLQLTGSFKIRGAINKILSLDERSRRAGVVAFSSGNHGQGIAAAARIVGCPAVIVLPGSAARIKIDNCRWWGAETVFYDPASEDRAEISRDIAESRGMTLVPPFDDLDVMAGQGTVGLELAEQLRQADVEPDAVVVNCSGGGLSSGVVEAVNSAFPGIESFIVERDGLDKMARSIATGRVCTSPDTSTSIMGAIGGPVAGALPLAVLRRHAVTGLTVSDEEALEAVSTAFRVLKIVLEPGGAASLAAVLAQKPEFRGRNVAVVASGGNVDAEVFSMALDEHPPRRVPVGGLVRASRP